MANTFQYVVKEHRPFAHPCKIKNCVYKKRNGRCVLHDHLEDTLTGECLDFVLRPERRWIFLSVKNKRSSKRI